MLRSTNARKNLQIMTSAGERPPLRSLVDEITVVPHTIIVKSAAICPVNVEVLVFIFLISVLNYNKKLYHSQGLYATSFLSNNV